MVNYLPGTPNLDYDFGQDFDYSLWTPNTQIDLVNVTWGNDYRDVVRFADRTALNTYIDSLEPAGIRLEQLSYVKPNEPVRINIPHNRAQKYNYVRATSFAQPVPGEDVGKRFFYFILDTRYIAPNTTELILQLDVWQTWIYDIGIGNCYVERGHIGIANELNFNNYGRDYLTNPEGLDTGTDMQVTRSTKDVIMTPLTRPDGVTGTSGVYSVLVMSTVQLDGDHGTVDAPLLKSAFGSMGLGMPSGATLYAWQSGTRFFNWLASMSSKPWVTQGIVSAMIVPNLERYYPVPIDWATDLNQPTTLASEGPHHVIHNMFVDWRDLAITDVTARYRHLKKFLTSPYCIVEMTTLSGNPIIIKPELWPRDDFVVREVASLTAPSAKIMFLPEGYNGQPDGDLNFHAEGFDHSTVIGNLPTMSIVNNMGISYLASHNYSIGWSRESANWTQQRALQGADTAFANSTASQNLMADLAKAGINANNLQTANTNRTQAQQAFVGGAGDVLSGLLSGGLFGGGAPGGNAGGAAGGAASAGIGAIANSINTNIQAGANLEAAGIANSRTIQATGAQQREAVILQDNNKALAQFSAKGDYANTIAGINAMVHDTNMMQPSVSGQQGGEILNFVQNEFGIHLRVKMVDKATMRRIGEFWLRYGYSVQAFINIPSDFKVMTKFTYWKLQETYLIAGPMPEGFKQVVSGIFQKGVTVWATPTDIGRIDWADNAPIPGITY